MFNVCSGCGAYRVDKLINGAGGLEAEAICPECGQGHPFLRQPLFVLTGASGAGKTAVFHHLTRHISQAVALEGDILWSETFHAPESWPRFHNLWLRLAKNIGQGGKPVLLAGAGLGVPSNLESCQERRYVGDIHYLALVCDDDALAQRLRARPAWRESGGEGFVASQLDFNRWFKEVGSTVTPLMTLLDTTNATVAETAVSAHQWLLTRLTLSPKQER